MLRHAPFLETSFNGHVRTPIGSFYSQATRVQASTQLETKEKSRIADTAFFFGAGGENRTLIACLEGTYISHYTTPA